LIEEKVQEAREIEYENNIRSGMPHGSDSEESGYFIPPPKAPKMRKQLDQELKDNIVHMLNEIMFDFDENSG